jgi:hypothetical protein
VATSTSTSTSTTSTARKARSTAKPAPAPDRRGEARLPAALAVLAAVALYAALPGSLLPLGRYVVPVLELLLLAPLLAFNPRRFTRETTVTRALSIALVGLIGAANLVSLGYLVHALVGGGVKDGTALLTASLQVWLTNIIVFGLLFWEMDRGGPVARTQRPRDQLPLADFRFSQDENHDAVSEVAKGSSITAAWVPVLMDYLYVSTTNSTAFSPTDTMPLSTRAKLLMSVESVAALVTSILVIARGVSLLK